MKKQKTKNQFVKNIDQLIELTEKGHHDYAIVLAGGLGLYSRKTIKYNKKTKKFSIYNHIDDSKMSLTHKELMDETITNIGKAMPLNSLIAIID